MGYSRNPENYNEEEQAVLLVALGKDITLRFNTSAEAMAQRGRFYGLRHAVLARREKDLKLTKQGFGELASDLEVVIRAVEVQRVGISWGNEEKTSIILGRNIGNARSQAVMREALGEGFTTPTDRLNQAAKEQVEAMKGFINPETGEIDMDKYMASRGHSEKTDDAIASAGYTVDGAEEEGNE